MAFLAPLLLAVTAGAFQPGDVVTVDNSYTYCVEPPRPSTGTIAAFDAEGQPKSVLATTDETFFSAAVYLRARGAILVALHRSGEEWPELDVLNADGSLTRLALLSALPRGLPGHMAVLPRGELLVLSAGHDAVHLDAAGRVIDQFTVPLLVGSVMGIDVAADGCTMVFARGRTVGRYDICAHRLLSDFASATDGYFVEVKLLPDGGILAGGMTDVRRYSQEGRLLWQIPLPSCESSGITAMSLTSDATAAWAQTGPYCRYLLKIDLVHAHMTAVLPAGQCIRTESVIVVGGWNAAENPPPPPPRPSRRRAVR